MNLSDGSFADLANLSSPVDSYYAFVKTFDDISGGLRRELLEVEFYADTDLPAAGNPAKEWDLGSDWNTNYTSCSQCVLVHADAVPGRRR